MNGVYLDHSRSRIAPYPRCPGQWHGVLQQRYVDQGWRGESLDSGVGGGALNPHHLEYHRKVSTHGGVPTKLVCYENIIILATYEHRS